MYEKVICFLDAADVQEFVNAAENCDFDIEVCYNQVVINAKSILGMLGLGVKNRLNVRYNGLDEQFEKVISKFALI